MLNLLKPGSKTIKATLIPTTGWTNVTNPENNGPYFNATGLTLVTVTGWNCDGIQANHWQGEGYIQAPTAGKNHTVTAVMDLTSNSLVVRVLNPTAQSKVIVNMQPLSLS